MVFLKVDFGLDLYARYKTFLILYDLHLMEPGGTVLNLRYGGMKPVPGMKVWFLDLLMRFVFGRT